MNKRFQDRILVEGSGKSKEMAINVALGTIQRKVISKYNGMILRIEPVDVNVKAAVEISYTERFLFFFFPRKRKKYKVTLEVIVDVFMMMIEDIEFEKREVPDNLKTMIIGYEKM